MKTKRVKGKLKIETGSKSSNRMRKNIKIVKVKH